MYTYLIVKILCHHLHMGTLLDLLGTLHAEADLGECPHPVRFPELFLHHPGWTPPLRSPNDLSAEVHWQAEHNEVRDTTGLKTKLFSDER